MKITKLLLITLTAIGLSACQLTDTFSSNTQAKVPPISVQLWSVKNELKTDFHGTIERIAKMGFDGVEFARDYGPYKNKPAELKKYLASKGLKTSASHVQFKDLDDKNFKKTVKFHQELDSEMLIISYDQRAWHPTGVKELVAQLNGLAKKLAPYHLKIGYHNHDGEFTDFQSETYWDYIAKNTDKNVVLQLDVGWSNLAQQDTVNFVKKYPNRTLTTHYKVKLPRKTKPSNDKPVIIGNDSFNWASLIKANISHGGTLWLVIEQEDYAVGLTPMQSVHESKKGLDKIIKSL